MLSIGLATNIRPAGLVLEAVVIDQIAIGLEKDISKIERSRAKSKGLLEIHPRFRALRCGPWIGTAGPWSGSGRWRHARRRSNPTFWLGGGCLPLRNHNFGQVFRCFTGLESRCMMRAGLPARPWPRKAMVEAPDCVRRKQYIPCHVSYLVPGFRITSYHDFEAPFLIGFSFPVPFGAGLPGEVSHRLLQCGEPGGPPGA